MTAAVTLFTQFVSERQIEYPPGATGSFWHNIRANERVTGSCSTKLSVNEMTFILLVCGVPLRPDLLQYFSTNPLGYSGTSQALEGIYRVKLIPTKRDCSHSSLIIQSSRLFL